MNKDWFNLKEGWIVSKCIPVVPLGLDLTYPAALQNLCAGATSPLGMLHIGGAASPINMDQEEVGEGCL